MNDQTKAGCALAVVAFLALGIVGSFLPKTDPTKAEAERLQRAWEAERERARHENEVKVRAVIEDLRQHPELYRRP